MSTERPDRPDDVPEWIKTAYRRQPRILYKTPEGDLCMGENQRRSAEVSGNYRRKIRQKENKEATFRVLYRFIESSEHLTNALVWLVAERGPLDLYADGPSDDKPSLNQLPPEREEDCDTILQRELHGWAEGDEKRLAASPVLTSQGDMNVDSLPEDIGGLELNKGVAAENKEKAQLIMTSKIPRVGLSLTVSTSPSGGPTGTPLFLHLSTVTRALTLDINKCFGDLTTSLDAAKDASFAYFKQFMVTRQFSRHAYRAAPLVCRLLLRLGTPTRLNDMSVSSADRFDVLGPDYLCHIHLRNSDLDDKLDPYFQVDTGTTPRGSFKAHLREAYFCAALALARPHTYTVSTIGVERSFVEAIDDMITSFDVQRLRGHGQKGSRSLDFDLYDTYVVEGSEGDSGTPPSLPFLNITCRRLQDMPMPSKTQVIQLHLGYTYYTEADYLEDDERDSNIKHVVTRGRKEVGVWTEMLGLVFHRERRSIHVFFPEGLKVEDGYNVIPHKVHLGLELGAVPPAELQTEGPPNPRDHRVRLLGITLHGDEEPSAQYLRMLEYSLELLNDDRDQMFCQDRSNLARYLSEPFGLPSASFGERRSCAMEHSLFGYNKGSLNMFTDKRLYQAQMDALQAIFDTEVDAVIVSGMGGTGKTYLIVQFSNRWGMIGDRMPEEVRVKHYCTRYAREVETRKGMLLSLETSADRKKKRKVETASSVEDTSWKDDVKKLKPLCLILTQTTEAARNVAYDLKESNVKFRLLKSSRFEGWSDAFYADFDRYAVSAAMLASPQATARTLQNSSVLVSTLGAFANVSKNVCMVGQPQVVMIDEASQVFAATVSATLQQLHCTTKLVLFGDVKQLQPYMHENVPRLHSALQKLILVYEQGGIKSERIRHIHLNQSRRMPSQLTNFFSFNRYDRLLLHGDGSSPTETVPGSHSVYLRYICSDSTDRRTVSGSRYNSAEAENIAYIANALKTMGLSFSIVTYYAAQRAEIELYLRDESRKEGSCLVSEDADDKVFTIDSYQGKDDDFIILSTVCSQFKEDEEAFVFDQHRQTVALSRCRRGMFVVSNARFLNQMNLLGSSLLCALWQEADTIYLPDEHSALVCFLDSFAPPPDVSSPLHPSNSQTESLITPRSPLRYAGGFPPYTPPSNVS
ncbi:hypothetical protein CBS101457_006047 [Exobasidium rhododendri]|nr:hypothetical protein CBS101457_006047 [Exobasidium rhododendri]